MMNKEQKSSFAALLVTPCFLGVACLLVVTLSPVSHKANAEALSKIQAQGELLREPASTALYPSPNSLPCPPSHWQQRHQSLRKHWRVFRACYQMTTDTSGQSPEGSAEWDRPSGAFGKR